MKVLMATTSDSILSTFQTNPTNYVGLFTLFSSKAKKISNLVSDSNVVTSAFAHVALVVIFHLNVFTAGTPTSTSLHFTADILGGIFSGAITTWNDPLIVAANSAKAAYLPSSPIYVVGRSDSCDENSLLSRFLSLYSTAFKSAYPSTEDDGSSSTLVLDDYISSSRLLWASSNLYSDSIVTAIDSSIGVYLQTNAPNSGIATYCSDSTCSEGDIAPNDRGVSINKCSLDSSTKISKSNLQSFDLMTSTASGCYPLTGTLDYSIYSTPYNDSSTCDSTVKTDSFHSRIKFSAWLFNGSTIVSPLSPLSVGYPTDPVRSGLYNRVCDIKCSGRAIGYDFCSYRDCSWDSGDFTQNVGACSDTSTREITYTLKNNTHCLRNDPSKEPRASISIPCTFVPYFSGIGIGSYIISGIGFLVTVVVIVLTLMNRQVQIIKRSQPIFVYVFLIGAACLNLTVIVYIGPNNDVNCTLRPWILNISSTVMFAPLIMKLHRVDVLFNNPKLRKIKVSDFQVIIQVLALLLVDIIILLLWTFFSSESQLGSIITSTTYIGVKLPIDDVLCNSGINHTFEIIMLIYKSCLLCFGVYKAVTTWKIPSDISEAKYFAVAIYNIAVIGGLCYFLGDFLKTTSVEIGVFLQCLGMFVSATLAVVVIMAFKLLTAMASSSKVASDDTSRDSRQSSMDSSGNPKATGYESAFIG